MAALRILIDQKNLAYRSGFIGRELSVVTLISAPGSTDQSCAENDGSKPHSIALTDNFLRIELDGLWSANTLLTAYVTETTSNGLRGIVTTQEAADELPAVLNVFKTEFATLTPIGTSF
jgi:hypothetical protein